jgi:hypothetical protein
VSEKRKISRGRNFFNFFREIKRSRTCERCRCSCQRIKGKLSTVRPRWGQENDFALASSAYFVDDFEFVFSNWFNVYLLVEEKFQASLRIMI